VKLILAIIFSLALSAQAASVIRSGTLRNGQLGTGSIPTSGDVVPGDGYEASLFAYYKCEDTTNTVADSAHGRNLGYNGGGNGSVSNSSFAAFIGNGFELGALYGFNSGLDLVSSGTDFSFSTNSFTIRFWVKTVASGFNNNWLGVFLPWNIYYGSPSTVDGKMVFEVLGNTNDSYLVSGESVSDGNWHRVTCWYDKGAFTQGIQIDTNTPVTAITDLSDTGTSDLEIFDPTDNLPNPPSPSFLVDEIAFWKDYVLTDADKTFDWNSGAGRTYPLP